MKHPKNVVDFLNEASSVVGKYETDMFSVSCSIFCDSNKIDSPIEVILYAALKTLRIINSLDEIEIEPQKKFGKYRVDFFFASSNGMELIVECDSQAFHDRTEKERRYEKLRDRYLQSSGYVVYRFTGSEIVSNPYLVASEILSFLTGLDKESILDGLVNYKD
jgi:very-short-patch-repair endonuclease